MMGGMGRGCVSIGVRGGNLIIDRLHTWLCWLWLCGAGS
jgi:hypothetical protein